MAPVRVHFCIITTRLRALMQFRTDSGTKCTIGATQRRVMQKCTACGVHNVNVTKLDGCVLTLRTYTVLNVNRGLAGEIVLTKCTGNPATAPSMPQLMFYARRSTGRPEAG